LLRINLVEVHFLCCLCWACEKQVS
jgi:hypothetical protein